MNKEIDKNMDLKMFVDRLIEEKKFPENLEKEVIEQIKTDLLSRVEDRVNMVIVSNLPEDKLEEFNQMLDKNVEAQAIQNFCAENIPDLAQLIASELIIFKQTYLS